MVKGIFRSRSSFIAICNKYYERNDSRKANEERHTKRNETRGALTFPRLNNVSQSNFQFSQKKLRAQAG